MDKLIKEYDAWLKANIPQEWIDNDCCCADSILYESFGGSLDLNKEQQDWLIDFIKRWEISIKQLKERK